MGPVLWGVVIAACCGASVSAVALSTGADLSDNGEPVILFYVCSEMGRQRVQIARPVEPRHVAV